MSVIQNEDLNILVQELSKKNPNPQLIKSKTDIIGIPYSSDLIILMSEVLVFISQNEAKPSAMKEKGI